MVILVVALLLDPAAVLLLMAAASARQRQLGPTTDQQGRVFLPPFKLNRSENCWAPGSRNGTSFPRNTASGSNGSNAVGGDGNSESGCWSSDRLPGRAGRQDHIALSHNAGPVRAGPFRWMSFVFARQRGVRRPKSQLSKMG